MNWLSICSVIAYLASTILLTAAEVPDVLNKSLKNGSLIIAGSGIASIKHITLETLSHIKEADKVYYAVSDPVTKAFIQDNSRGNYSDLNRFYGKDKSRYETYVQMSEVMLNDVRAGMNVLGIFYGHPGIFVLPSHRAIAIARDEGYAAKMLPGVSSQDYLFADLGIDPALPHGWMTQDATEVVVRDRIVQPDVHNVIFQVGSVIVDTADYEVNTPMPLARIFSFNILDRSFPSDHTIVHYIGAILPQAKTIMERYTISQLHDPLIQQRFTSSSTFYVPPVGELSLLDAEIALGMTHASQLYPYSAWSCMNDLLPSSSAYGPFEQQAVAKLHDYQDQAPDLALSPAMRSFMSDLALQPKIAVEYAAEPNKCLNKRAELTELEKYALSFNHPGPIYALAKGLYPQHKRDDGSVFDDIARAVNDASSPASDAQMQTINRL